jgi:hypothetical protein
MSVIDDLLATLPDGQVLEIRVGAFWTAVVVQVNGHRHCGLASTLRTDEHHHSSRPAIREAGRLTEMNALRLAGLAFSSSVMEAAIGIATINALLPRRETEWTDLNAEEFIARHGAGKRVALIGHFPFVPRLRERVGTLSVLEERPQGDDLPAEAAPDIIPQADILAMTGTTLINSTFEGLMALHRSDALVLLLGPSTPLSTVLFDYGVQVLSGAVVEDIDAVLRAVGEGANFQQLHRLGVRLVTMQKPSSA